MKFLLRCVVVFITAAFLISNTTMPAYAVVTNASHRIPILPQVYSSAERTTASNSVSYSRAFLPILSAQTKQLCFWIFCNPRPPSRESSRPSSTRAAGRRGRCSTLSTTFRALAPISPHLTAELDGELPESSENSLGFTISSTPTFWFYLPPLPKGNSGSSSSVKLAEFMLQDEHGDDLISQPLIFEVRGQPGLVYFSLPGEVSERIKAGKPYHWYFSIICDVRRPSRNPSVNGWIQRETQLKQREVETALHRVRAKAEQVEILVSEDLWYDALDVLINSRCQSSSSKLDNYWLKLLEEFELEESQVSATVCNPEQRLRQLSISST